ncbi:beta-ketoacyl-ACP synthase III [Bacillota bacterium Meth-B3]
MNIWGTGSALPALSVDNERLTKFLDTSDEWIRSRTGICERRILGADETLLGLGAQAGARALEDAGVSPADVDLLICATLQGDTITPSLASLLQAQMGLPCPAFDLNAACSGFPYALNAADAFIASGKARAVLVVAAEGLSRLANWTDRSTCVLFGDGAGAVLCGPGEALKALKLTSAGAKQILYADAEPGGSPFGTKARAFAGIHMEGQEVYRFAVSSCLRDLETVIGQAGLTPDDIDCFVLHQANKRIVEAVRARLRQPEDKFPTNIERRGNTSSASIPILLDELNRAGRFKAGDRLALAAFGAGLTTGACVIEWTKA